MKAIILLTVVVLALVGVASGFVLFPEAGLRGKFCQEITVPEFRTTALWGQHKCLPEHTPTLVASAKRCVGYMAVEFGQRMEAFKKAHRYDRESSAVCELGRDVALQHVLNHYAAWGEEEMHWSMPCTFQDKEEGKAFREKLAAELEAAGPFRMGEPPAPAPPTPPASTREGADADLPFTWTISTPVRQLYYLVWRSEEVLALAQSRVTASIDWHDGGEPHKGPLLSFRMADVRDECYGGRWPNGTLLQPSVFVSLL